MNPAEQFLNNNDTEPRTVNLTEDQIAFITLFAERHGFSFADSVAIMLKGYMDECERIGRQIVNNGIMPKN